MPIRSVYGFKPSLPDQRDLILRFSEAQRRATAPTIDLRSSGLLPDVWDQGQLGSCTAHGSGAAYSYDLAKQGSTKNYVPSRLFVYYSARVLENTVSSDSGATITDVVKGINKYGAPPESDWGYDIDRYAEKPPAVAFSDGLARQAVKYARVPGTVADIQATLTVGYPVVIGFTVYDSFESAAVASSGVVPMPASSESVLGGHCVLVVGYVGGSDLQAQLVTAGKDSSQVQPGWLYAIIRNSWGTDWGHKGYCYMPMQYLTNPNLASDFWVIQQVESDDPTPVPPQPGPTPAPQVDLDLAGAFRAWERNVLSHLTKAGRLRDAGDAWLDAHGY